MRKRKEEVQGPRVRAKAQVRSDIENYLIFEGILLILIFFMLIATFRGPYIGTYVNYVEDDETYVEVPIWIVFVYMGSISIYLGFLLKVPRLIKGIDRRLRFFTPIGLVVTGANMVGMTGLFLLWFGGLYIKYIDSLAPILLLVALGISTLYLIFDWIVIHHGVKKHLPL